MKLIKNDFGFTLIEVLLVIAIIVILASGSYVGFVKFGRQQSLNIARDNLLNTLNEARSNAMSQVISTSSFPNGCKQPSTFRTLIGHQVTFNVSGSPHYYSLQEVCSSGATTFTPTVKRINLPKDVEFVTTPPLPASVRFLVLTGGVNNPATIAIRSTRSVGSTRTITVNESGVISSN